MENNYIKIYKNGVCHLNSNSIGQNGENLQRNIVFNFPDGFIDGIGYLEIQMPDGTTGLK